MSLVARQAREALERVYLFPQASHAKDFEILSIAIDRLEEIERQQEKKLPALLKGGHA